MQAFSSTNIYRPHGCDSQLCHKLCLQLYFHHPLQTDVDEGHLHTGLLNQISHQMLIGKDFSRNLKIFIGFYFGKKKKQF